LIETNPASQASRTIALDILRFDADAAGLVTLKARWELLGRAGSLVGAPRNAVIVKTGSGRDSEAVAITMSSALADLSGDIATGLGAVAAIEPEDHNGEKFGRSVSDLPEMAPPTFQR
jgi:uncharacterized lipoprotein YmbA